MSQPTEPGWYWYRFSDQHRWSVREVYEQNGLLLHNGVQDDENTLENYPGDWVKIPTPEEPEQFSGEALEAMEHAYKLLLSCGMANQYGGRQLAKLIGR